MSRTVREMEARQPFSDSDITSAALYTPLDAGDPVPPADIAALSRLSDQLGSLLHTPGLAFCFDASITVESAGEELPRDVHVHRCVLSSRSPLFRDKFEKGETSLELRKLVEGFDVGYEALGAVIQYVYTGRLEELPLGVAECTDKSCFRHEACWPAVHFMLQVLHAASTFDIGELVSVFQRRLLDIVEKVTEDDMLAILFVADLNKKICQKLLVKCIQIVGKLDFSYITLEKKLPLDVVNQIKQIRNTFGIDGYRKPIFPDKHAKRIYAALDSDDIELVKLLLEERNTNLDTAKALHYAVAYCDLKTIKELLDLRLADINGSDHRNYTVLHIAAMRKEPEIIMSLLRKGAQPLYKTSDGRTALDICKRYTRSVDYSRSTAQGKLAPRERLCIEMLELSEMRDATAEVTSVPAEMSSADLHERLWYLESRVWLAENLFPAEAKAAMSNANVEGSPKFKSRCLPKLCFGKKRSSEDEIKTSFKKEENLSWVEALTETVRLGMQFFPRCSKVIDKILCDDLPELPLIEYINTEERKNRYNEILDEIKLAFLQDKNANGESTSPATSKPARSVRSKIARI